jgi:hypothetical protein
MTQGVPYEENDSGREIRFGFVNGGSIEGIFIGILHPAEEQNMYLIVTVDGEDTRVDPESIAKIIDLASLNPNKGKKCGFRIGLGLDVIMTYLAIREMFAWE